jgi:hypothetical protein
MGICGSKDNSKHRTDLSENENKKQQHNNHHHNQIPSSKTSQPKIQIKDPIFEDMPEWEGERYKGYGIKQMKGYKCDLKINELNKLRDEFWSSKKVLRHQWKIIHQACVYDHIKAEEYLARNEMKTVNGCINNLVDIDGNEYKIPNYCINDPYFELELLQDDGNNKKEINIKLIDLCNIKHISITVNENITGKELKEIYAQQNNIDLTNNKIRLLFGGGLIKDDETLYQHKVHDGFSIQVCVSSID